ncbi:hypothetical protein WH95_13505 [Kiloniella litopenaei]|uniref:site-specific DNA-methyltransferase (adenine-specific) n=1 Tax=Kiloniella litopenaei TaxID=1549748 RepID=A0A0M2R750_9PROT|nr:DNA methyltransferase [Kiloniella litopenaei]KKJ76239.1 hypothetical protein WH95_13505 [Kiloniella litopenaei]
MNIAEIEMGLKAIAEQGFDKNEFPFQFIGCFDTPKATTTKLKGKMNKAKGENELLWAKKLYFKPSPQGAAAQTVDAMNEEGLVNTHAPRFLLSTDGEEFTAYDRNKDDHFHGTFSKLNDSFDFFLGLANIERYEAVEETIADIRAAGRLAKLYDAILANNSDWYNDEHAHTLNLFMTRLLFCLFAEDTGIFEQDLFSKSLNDYTDIEGRDVGPFLEQIFEIMDTPPNERGDIPAHINRFPFVNGGLFKDHVKIPKFGKLPRRILIEAGRLNWREINPDIFGSMIQAVVEPEMRGDLGMHYTSVPNIMKVLHPLFLLDLEKQFSDSQDSPNKLEKLHQRLSKIRVFDPACGSGNFLIIAYRELRKLEMRIYKRLQELTGELGWKWSEVKLTNFYGIEYADFASETAKLSLWIAEYQMNKQFADIFGDAPPALPLKESGNIKHGNALRVNWEEVCPPAKDDIETYIVGNPPYLGSTFQSKEQKEDLELLFKPLTKSYKNLDYVAGWYLKAVYYNQKRRYGAAFVATNSICQGEQVNMLWQHVYARQFEISFAHQSFKWKNNASKNAGVTCVIVGICPKNAIIGDKILFTAGVAKKVKNIGPYLLEMSDVIVGKEGSSLTGLPKMSWGNKATDNGNLILSPDERASILEKSPEAVEFIKRYYGSQEFIKGIERYCIWIADNKVEEAKSIPELNKRIQAVHDFRAASKAPQTRDYAVHSHRFRQIQGYGVDAVFVPRISSEKRPYMPVGFMSEDDIINDQAYAIYGAEPFVFALISSKLHYVWVKTVCGQMETRIRYSNTMGYNTFPIPFLSDDDKKILEELAWEIIEAREEHPGKTIADLYDPKKMPENLLKAHKKLDMVLETMYVGEPFKNDTVRLEHLFKMYAKMTKKKAG